MTCVGVVAHTKKSIGGGLPQLRALLAERGVTDPVWHDVRKSRKAPAAARRALKDGADLILVWGGDGTVQRCLDALAGSTVPVGILPAGTANLLAANLGVPTDLVGALDVALDGQRRVIDLGSVNGERFAVMAGTGFDALMMRAVDGPLKKRLGQLSYVWTGARAARARPVKTTVEVDGKPWFKGRASCVLFGNMGRLTGGLTAFPDARPDDGLLEIGVVTADGPVQWARVLTRMAMGRPERSNLVKAARGKRVNLVMSRPQPYELDGGARDPARRLEAECVPRAAIVCVPESRC